MKKNQPNLELRNTMTKLNNSIDSVSIRFDQIEEKISKVKERTIEIIQLEK